jgi:hypothetical protein
MEKKTNDNLTNRIAIGMIIIVIVVYGVNAYNRSHKGDRAQRIQDAAEEKIRKALMVAEIGPVASTPYLAKSALAYTVGVPEGWGVIETPTYDGNSFVEMFPGGVATESLSDALQRKDTSSYRIKIVPYTLPDSGMLAKYFERKTVGYEKIVRSWPKGIKEVQRQVEASKEGNQFTILYVVLAEKRVYLVYIYSTSIKDIPTVAAYTEKIIETIKE